MKQFHCIVGNKGGVGKSLAASWLIQYGFEQGWNVLPIECDQGNRTLSRYERLRTERLELLDPEHQIDRRRFDALIETLVQRRRALRRDGQWTGLVHAAHAVHE